MNTKLNAKQFCSYYEMVITDYTYQNGTNPVVEKFIAGVVPVVRILYAGDENAFCESWWRNIHQLRCTDNFVFISCSNDEQHYDLRIPIKLIGAPEPMINQYSEEKRLDEIQNALEVKQELLAVLKQEIDDLSRERYNLECKKAVRGYQTQGTFRGYGNVYNE